MATSCTSSAGPWVGSGQVTVCEMTTGAPNEPPGEAVATSTFSGVLPCGSQGVGLQVFGPCQVKPSAAWPFGLMASWKAQGPLLSFWLTWCTARGEAEEKDPPAGRPTSISWGSGPV